MASIALLSPQPLSGKTTVAAGLARAGGGAVLKRSGSDEHSETDTKLFAKLSTNGAAHTIVELSAGETAAEPGSTAVVVANGGAPLEEVAEFCKQAGAIAGVVLNRTPAKRAGRLSAAYSEAGLRLLATIPEDRVLAAPLLGEVVQALKAEANYLSNGATASVIDNPVVASIASDPGQGYFVRENPSAVIVRSDKPDLQLAALNAGAPALIITGGLPILGYVRERAEEDEIPIVRTLQDTVQAVNTIEELFGALPFSGASPKVQRISELLQDSDLLSLLK